MWILLNKLRTIEALNCMDIYFKMNGSPKQAPVTSWGAQRTTGTTANDRSATWHNQSAPRSSRWSAAETKAAPLPDGCWRHWFTADMMSGLKERRLQPSGVARNSPREVIAWSQLQGTCIDFWLGGVHKLLNAWEGGEVSFSVITRYAWAQRNVTYWIC